MRKKIKCFAIKQPNTREDSNVRARVVILITEKINFIFYFLKYFIYLFLERGGGREKERKRNIDV